MSRLGETMWPNISSDLAASFDAIMMSEHPESNFTFTNHEEDEMISECERTIKLIDSVFFFFCVAIVVIGVFGNSAGIIMLLWSRCRIVNSLNVYLISVYVCDLGFLLCLSLQLAKIGKVALHTQTSLSCEIAVYVVNVLSFVSQWSMWAISAERYLAVCHPMSMKYRRFSTVQAAINVMLTVAVVAMGIEIWVFFVVETNEQGECDFRPNTSWLFDVFNLIDSFLSYALPGLLIFFFTYSIFRALYGRRSTFREIDPSALRTTSSSNNDRDRRSQGHHHGQSSGGGGGQAGIVGSYETVVVISRGTSERVHRRERQAAWFLVAIVLSDTILNVQNYSLRLFNTFYEPEPRHCVTYRSVQVISYMLYYCQFAANVFYLLFCPSTRQFVASRKSSRPESASGAETTRKRSSESCYQRSKVSVSNNSPVSVHVTLRESGNTATSPLLLRHKSASMSAIEAQDL